MDVQIKHNGTNISGFVIRYEREHKICTGIGILQLEVDRNIGRTFDPWDTIDIHENGDFKVRYYISSVEDDIPRGTKVIDCQDVSKRLVDYFIPDTYVIDTPTYTRYWIEKFLTEAGVDYIFNTSSSGNLISNNTQLGLQTAYEQLLTLLQMSGWYMYFDGNEKAVIGSLSTDLASSAGTLDRTDILEISKNSDDKMLRNRALVLGAFNIFTMQYAKADVTVHTRWNYDNRDVRTVVISNSNIPDNSTAYGMANQIIKEFAKITVEKHIQAWGARDFNLGEMVRVNSTVWRGSGMITTFGTSMSKDGLVTNIILDERCPRLFGFFDFGDYVYVGTFGEGIWRKHLKFDHTWHDFSTGLTNLNITDLHINNGVFGSVGHSGQMYYANSAAGPWNPLAIESLSSSDVDVTSSGAVNYIPFSGIRARATIVDKIGNTVKFGVDTWSGYNMGDYFLNYQQMVSSVSFSGITLITGTTISGSNRGWIVEYDPYTGQLVGGLGSGIYPIHYSGIYNLTVIDLENDGKNDYVSVRIGGAAQVDGDGRHVTQPYATTYDFYGRTVMPNVGETYDSNRVFASIGTPNAVIAISDALDDVPRILYQLFVNSTPTYALRELRYTRVQDEEGNWSIVRTTTTSPNTGSDPALALFYHGDDIYSVYYYRMVAPATYTFYRRVWNAVENSLGVEETLDAFDYSVSARGHTGTSLGHYLKSITVNNTLYCLIVQTYHAPSSGGQALQATHMYLTMVKIGLATGSISASDIHHLETGQKDDEPTWTDYYYISGSVSSPTEPVIDMVQSGGGIKILGWYGLDFIHNFNVVDVYEYISDWFLIGDDTSVGATRNYEAESRDTIDFISNHVPATTKLERTGMDATPTSVRGFRAKQLTVSTGYIIGETSTASDLGNYGFTFDSQGVLRFNNVQAVNAHWFNPARAFPIFYGNLQYYISRDNAGDFWLCSSVDKERISKYTAPTGWTLIKPLAGTDAFFNVFYWIMRDSNFEYWLVPATLTEFFTAQGNKISSTVSTAQNEAGIFTGPFVIIDIDRLNPVPEDAEIHFIYREVEGGYVVLQREGMDYNLIQRDSFPIRVDISNNAPVLTVMSGDFGFRSHYVYSDSVETVIPADFFNPLVISGYQVEDYRYTFLEPTYSGVLASGEGVAIQQIGLYIRGSGIYARDIRTYSGEWTQMFPVSSGYGRRIETSNYGLGGQYIFITSSGFIQQFYQKDPTSPSFIYYSGLPQSRATIIRLDDRL